MKELPKKFLENMQTQLSKEEFALFLAEYDKPFIKTIRLNNIRNIDDHILNLINLDKDKKLNYANAYIVDNTRKFGNHPLHHAGVFYVQEASAMLPALCVKFSDGDLVLDMCAAPGGKSSQIAEQIPKGTLVSNEIITNRAIVLKENITRLGFKNVIVTSTTPENLTKLGNIFDKILVDAPCSGEGLFRKEDESIVQWDENINAKNAERQNEILDYASKLCKSGGSIIYSTCTFSRLENEDVCKKFLKEHKNFVLGNIEEVVKQNTTCGYDNIGRRGYPFSSIGEGQFMAVFTNTDAETFDQTKEKTNMRKLSNKERSIFDNWVKENLANFDCEVLAYEDNIFAIPTHKINTTGIFTLQYGVNLGKIIKDRFDVNHNFFTAFGHQFKNQLQLSLYDENVKKYLLGESLTNLNIKNGYACVMIENNPVGGIKVVGDRANNLYPKHLRVTNSNFNF